MQANKWNVHNVGHVLNLLVGVRPFPLCPAGHRRGRLSQRASDAMLKQPEVNIGAARSKILVTSGKT
jgi:hypothetical protein